MTDTLVGTPDPDELPEERLLRRIFDPSNPELEAPLDEGEAIARGDWESWGREMEEGGWLDEDDGWWDEQADYIPPPDPDPFPEPDEDFVDWVDPNPIRRAHMFERFIVTLEDASCDDEAHWVYAVRARMVAAHWPEDETPHYNEPLLRGDEMWCKLAADALNEAMEP